MPRYYFDFRDGPEVIADSEGTELPDDEAAQREATDTLTRVAHDTFPRHYATGEIAIMVYRQDRSHLLSITLTLTTTRGDQQA
jgi:hypothetical protein